jgi:hypothetical protein
MKKFLKTYFTDIMWWVVQAVVVCILMMVAIHFDFYSVAFVCGVFSAQLIANPVIYYITVYSKTP